MFHYRQLLAAVLVCVLGHSALAAPIVSIVPPITQVEPGAHISVDVTLSGASDIYAWQFDLFFDPAVLSATTVTEGAFFGSSPSHLFLPGSIDNTSGTIMFTADSLVGPGAGLDGGGVLASIEFDVVGAMGTSSPLTLSNVALLDSALQSVPAELIDGAVNVAEPATWLLLFLLPTLGFARRILSPLGRFACGSRAACTTSG